MIAVELFDRYGFTGASAVAPRARRHHLDRPALLLQLRAGPVVRRSSAPRPATRRSRSSRRGRCGGSGGRRVATAIFGLLISGATEDYYQDFFKRANGASIFLGMIIALVMFANVWM